MAKVLSVRVDDDLASWVESYASQRGVKRVVVLEAALREFRGLCATGVPDLPEPKSGGRPKGESTSSTRPGVVSAEPSSIEAIRAKAARAAARARAERERKIAERGW